MNKKLDYRGFTYIKDGLTHEVVGKPFYHGELLVCTVDVWNSTKTRVNRRDEVSLSVIEEHYNVYLKAKKER